MKQTLAAAPLFEPVLLAELLRHVRVAGDSGDRDTELQAYQKVARVAVEDRTWRALINQTWDFYYDSFTSPIYLPRPPVSSITYFKYYDTSDTLQTLSTDVYELGEVWGVGTARLKHDQTWPADFRGHTDDIVIRCVCGYGAAGASVPEGLRHAIKMMVADMWEFPETVVNGSATKLPTDNATMALLAPYKVRLTRTGE